MADDPDRKLDLRLVPADAPPDAQVIDDLIRLIRQGITTAPPEYPQVSVGTGFRAPNSDEKRDLAAVEARIKHRVEQASRDSQAAVVDRAKIAAQPDADQKLAEEARRAAEAVIASVQSALLRGIRVQVPDDPPALGPT